LEQSGLLNANFSEHPAKPLHVRELTFDMVAAW
jgi:hypothetical protein